MARREGRMLAPVGTVFREVVEWTPYGSRRTYVQERKTQGYRRQRSRTLRLRSLRHTDVPHGQLFLGKRQRVRLVILFDRDIEELRRDNDFPTWFGFLDEDVPRITIDTHLDGLSVLRPMRHYFVHLLANASTIFCAIEDE